MRSHCTSKLTKAGQTLDKIGDTAKTTNKIADTGKVADKMKKIKEFIRGVNLMLKETLFAILTLPARHTLLE